MRKFVVLAATFALALAVAAPAKADSILFDPDGAGGLDPVLIDLFDPTVGNSITLGLSLASTAGDTGTVLFQANLGVASLGGVTQFTSCQEGADCFTFVAAVDVIVTAVSAELGVLRLALDPNAELNVLNMYANTTGDNLTGLGFTTGDLIMSATFTTFASLFGVDDFTPQALDQFGNNDYPGVTTLVGQGSFNGALDVDLASLDPAYFLNTFTSLFLSATSQTIIPYRQGDPSACFSSDAVANCDQLGVGSVGLVNGLGSNTMLQTDANVSFTRELQVPEPAALLLLGVGLAAGGFARRRQIKKAAKR